MLGATAAYTEIKWETSEVFAQISCWRDYEDQK